MQRILYCFTVVLLTTSNLCAQTESNRIWNQDGNDNNTFNSKAPPPPPDPIPNNVPIDGGVGILLIAGALYGKSRLNKIKRDSQTKG